METTTTKCISCKTDILLENAMLLHWCYRTNKRAIWFNR